MANDPRGSIVQQGNFLRIDNAFVEEVSAISRNSGFIVVSYSVPWQNGLTSIETLRLNVTNSTVTLNAMGLPMCFCDLRPGMWVNVTFSPRMTRSIPPQATAFIIAVRRAPAPVRPPVNNNTTTTERIVRVDANNNMLYTGVPNDSNRQTRFVITNSTVIQNRDGMQVGLRSLRPGQLVRIAHANFQTAGIPPQTTAFHIQVL